MRHIKANEKVWEENAGYSKMIYLSQKDINVPGARIQQIKIKSGDTAKNHYHKIQTEIFYFLNSNGYWIINGEKFKPEKGDVLVIEPNDRHEVVSDSNEDYLYLAFKYNYQDNDSFTE